MPTGPTPDALARCGERDPPPAPAPPSPPVKADRAGVEAAEAECLDCDSSWDGLNSFAVAARHAETTGHSVRARQVVWAAWNGARSSRQQRLEL